MSVSAMINPVYLKLARATLHQILKATDNAAIGRTPTVEEISPTDAPSVPSEIADVTPIMEDREPEEVIRDAISVLEEGLAGSQDESQGPDIPELDDEEDEEEEEMPEDVDKLLDSARNEVSSVVAYSKSADDTRVSVKAIIKDGQGRTLVLRDAYSDYWDLPGGHVQDDEKLIEALKREVSEETGLQLGSCSERGSRMLKLGPQVRPVMFYDAQVVSGQPRMSEEHVGFQWAGDEDLKDLNLGVFKDILIPGPDTREILEVGNPESTRKQQGPMQIGHYQNYSKDDEELDLPVEKEGEGGIAGTGAPLSSGQIHTDTAGPDKRRNLDKLSPLAKLQEIVGDTAFMKGLETLEAIKSAIRKNVNLIGSITDEDKKDLVHDIFSLYLMGEYGPGQAFNPIELQLILLKEYDLTPTQAKLIAWDQESKLMGAVTEKWHQQAGITEYIWQTQLDDKVRPTHKANQGKIFSWASPPPETGHPGSDINCRCNSVPVINRRSLVKGYTISDLVFPIRRGSVSTGGGQVITGAETEIDYIDPDSELEVRSTGNTISRERAASHVDSAIESDTVNIIKMIDVRRNAHELLASTRLKVISKARAGKPFIIAGYASPVIVDQEGHKISHEALAKDLPRFLGANGEYAALNLLHSNLTIGKVLPEWTDEKGKTYKTQVDDVGLYAVAQIRTDKDAPEVIQDVIKDINTGKLKSFSISGNAENPVFTCNENECYYGINRLQIFEITACEAGVNQEANFDIISKSA